MSSCLLRPNLLPLQINQRRVRYAAGAMRRDVWPERLIGVFNEQETHNYTCAAPNSPSA